MTIFSEEKMTTFTVKKSIMILKFTIMDLAVTDSVLNIRVHTSAIVTFLFKNFLLFLA